MKKVMLFLLVMLVAAGAVWAQALPSANDRVSIGRFFVDQTMSTEKRYSADIFSSYADDFLWFTSYDANVGNFLLLGGYPGDDSDVVNTNTPPYVLNFGYAKTLKFGYLGLYYGGNLVEASGSNNGLSGKDNVVTDESTWTNRLVIFFGKKGLGGFRFDMLFEGTHYEDKYVDGKPNGTDAQTVTNAPQIALGWGTALESGLEIYAQIGYDFGDMTVNTDADGKKKDTIWNSSILALQAGINKPLASTDASESSFSVDFLMGYEFGGSGEGDLTLKDAKYVNGGAFLLGADVAYKQIIKADEKLSFGFKPNATLGFVFDDSNSLVAGSKKTFGAAKIIDFELDAGVNLGLEYKINPKFNLYTGLGLTVINWRTEGHLEGKDQKYDKNNPNTAVYKSSSWTVTGLAWRDNTLHGSNLGFGLTFTPTKNIEVGFGLNTFLDNIISLNVKDMKIETGLNKNNGDGELAWLSDNIFGGLQFDLTITAKF